MRVLITGGTGLLGQELTKQLLLQKHEVTQMARNQNNVHPNAQFLAGDILDFPLLMEHFASFDLVIHTAAMVSFAPKDRKQLYDINVTGTENVVNACLELGVKKLIYVSSVAALGKPAQSKAEKNMPITINEQAMWVDSAYNSDYGKSKYLGEKEVWRGHAEGLDVAIVNPSVILGEGNINESSTRLFGYIKKKNQFYTNGYINVVDVRDVVQSILTIIEKQTSGERYIVNGYHLSYQDFFQQIANAFKVKPPSILLNQTAIEILWRLEYLRSILTKSDPLITKETSMTARSNIYFENKKIKRELGLSFGDLGATIQRVANFLSNQE